MNILCPLILIFNKTNELLGICDRPITDEKPNKQEQCLEIPEKNAHTASIFVMALDSNLQNIHE